VGHKVHSDVKWSWWRAGAARGWTNHHPTFNRRLPRTSTGRQRNLLSQTLAAGPMTQHRLFSLSCIHFSDMRHHPGLRRSRPRTLRIVLGRRTTHAIAVVCATSQRCLSVRVNFGLQELLACLPPGAGRIHTAYRNLSIIPVQPAGLVLQLVVTLGSKDDATSWRTPTKYLGTRTLTYSLQTLTRSWDGRERCQGRLLLRAGLLVRTAWEITSSPRTRG
jgi:hypothetical protein